MGISIEQYRLRVGLFTSNFEHNTKRLRQSEVLCILLFFFSHRKTNALRVIVFIHFIIDLLVLKKCLKNITKMTKVDKSAPSLPDKPTVDSKLTNSVMHIFFLLFVLQMLLILGGIETNPGPELPIDDELSSSFNDSSEMSSIYETFSTSVSFIHLNIQSLVPKLDLIYAEYEHFDIMSFTETWLKGDNSDDSIELLNFQKPFRRDRGPEKNGGGVVVYIKENIYAYRRPDLEVNGIEAIWVQIKINGNKVLYGTFYVPPKSNTDSWNKVENSIESAVNDDSIDYVIVTGDFNDNQLDVNNVKMRNISMQYSLQQLVEDPTNFTEHSSSLIDLILTNDVNFVPYAGVGPPLLDQVRYHCPVIGFLNAPKPVSKSFKRKI